MDKRQQTNRVKDQNSYLIARICHAHRNFLQNKHGEFKLHVGQEMFLLPLWEQDGMSLTQLAERLYVQQTTISRMLARIERGGLVTRVKYPEDGRV